MTRRRGFTIIELLVVISIIALLIGILLPAIGRARDSAKVTQSESNLRNLGVAHATYSSEWNDRQFTLCRDDLALYGTAGDYNGANGTEHPPVLLGWAEGGLWGYWMDWPGNWVLVEPMRFSGGQVRLGSWRIPNASQFNRYVSGRFYDDVWYAPKDDAAVALVQEAQGHPGEFSPIGQNLFWTSYVMSPAGMYNPDVFANPERNRQNPGQSFNDPYSIPAGFRSPTYSQSRFPDLKTQMIEHHWLQNTRGAYCNPCFMQNGDYDGCQPYFFNHGYESAPVSLFYDSHVRLVGVREAMSADERQENQAGYGLWSRDTPFGDDGYLIQCGYDWSDTSFHVLTIDGILGRDTLNTE
jgi:prepilin-type N-terminal cleavage/methylation domain-containing protein